MSEHKHTNRLAEEKSPYLLQHAHNPVDWYPWGDEAFAKAKAEDKPIFLSVGYSTCHWCHVMERESFEDEEVATVLNASFICIKVDREERPDIDTVYMSVCQSMTGHGGWPLNIVMTPDKRPFYAGTYFPKTGRFGRPGLMEIVPALSSSWHERRDEMLTIAGQVTDHLQATMSTKSGDDEQIKTSIMDEAYADFERLFDPTYGGFGRAPKFPTPHSLMLLLRHWHRTGQAKALDMVEKTLTQIGIGGVYDHVGYGFHRYSTDREWLVPHFEKMLYDQALLCMAYTEAYQVNANPIYAQKIREIITYVLRDMTSPQGGFFSAEDADSEGEEGKFYIWSTSDLKQVLSPDDADLAIHVYGATDEGNFLDEATKERMGTNILHMRQPLSKLAKSMGTTEQELKDRLDDLGHALWVAREKRIHPYKDDKILTDWNGLMIAALAEAGRVLGDEAIIDAARQAAHFVLTNLRQADGRLLKRHRDGEAALPAHLDDYAFMIWGLIELHQATHKSEYLQTAIELNDLLIQHFWDSDQGGFFLTADDAEPLPVRPKEAYDGAIPSGNSVSALNNLRLARLTGKQELEQIADRIFQAFADQINEMPTSHTLMLSAWSFAQGPSHEVVIVGTKGATDTQRLLAALNQPFAPNKVVVFYPFDQGAERTRVEQLAPFVQGQQAVDDQATAYICTGFTCRRPTHSVEEMLKSLRGS